ncbi:hypothetical protein ALC60_07340 [Trachymyrmex zeteki]|uniref:Uncharacterized protein n=1 Tax=Mycetomoellerius zeteki TaxID=64791 RepID=A0A151X063_9HYME|nr:hypothetical protein ALC60_07340 [Trachymyrmex zeteki]
MEMPRLREASDQSLAPLPHTHSAALAVPLLPGHLQQDRHSALPHTHQTQGDAVRREGVLVEDGDCPAEETATATSTVASALRALGCALLRLRAALTPVLRVAGIPGTQMVRRPREKSASSDRVASASRAIDSRIKKVPKIRRY